MVRCLVATGVAAAILLPVLIHQGWPYNHNALMDFSRMYAVVGQWRLGHLIPVWSTAEQWGFGSPAPSLYNKSFLYVSSAFLLLTGDPKAAMCLALAGFMIVAFCGAAAAVRVVLPCRVVMAEWTAGALVLSCNYTTTDWFVRGAVAEFAALAVATWVFAWCLTMVAQGRWALWIGPVMAALALSHVIIGLYALIPLGLSVLIALATWPRRVRDWSRPAIGSVALFAILVSPFELPLLIFTPWANVHVLAMFTPDVTHLQPLRLFWDRDWHWGERWDGFTIQLDLLPCAGLVLLALLVAGRRPPGSGRMPRPMRDAWTRVVALLGGVVVIMLLLQLSQAGWVYRFVPGASLIQFSWRLLTFVSVALAIGCGLLVGWLRARWPGPVGGRVSVCAALLLVASTAPNKPWWSGIRYKWFTPEEMARSDVGILAAAGEYLPHITVTDGLDVVHVSSVWRPEVNPHAPPCTVTTEGDPTSERGAMRFRAVCSAATQLTLPVFAAPGLSVQINGAPVASAARQRSCDNALLRVALAPGVSTITLQPPYWRATVAAFLAGDDFHYERVCR